jgi:hypothetical protein
VHPRPSGHVVGYRHAVVGRYRKPLIYQQTSSVDRRWGVGYNYT